MGKTEIRGAQIKDESIDSADMASGSIKAGEMSEESISGQATITSTDTTNDRLLIWDATDSALKQVSIGNLGVTASPAGSDTQIQYNNGGALGGAAAFYWDDANNRVGIGTSSPDYALDVSGNIGADEYIYHNGDSDTFIRFQDDDIVLKAGNVNFIKLTEDDSQDKLICNEGRADLDFIVRSPNESLALYLNADNEVFHINHGESAFKTKIHSTNGETLTVNDSGVILNEDGAAANDFRVESDNDTHMFFIDGGNDKVGIGTTGPKTALDIHHNPTSLSNDTGGGEVVKFGGGTLTTGKLYFLHIDGNWTATDGDAIATGADQLLGIALGATPGTNGILLKGFFDAETYLPAGAFSSGKAVYVCSGSGFMNTTTPTGTGAFVRIVGYCTSTANVIYFDPDKTWVEL